MSQLYLKKEKKPWRSCVISQMCHFKSSPSTLMRPECVCVCRRWLISKDALYPLDLDLRLKPHESGIMREWLWRKQRVHISSVIEVQRAAAAYPQWRSGGSPTTAICFLPICLFFT